jgi:molybdopterin-biosynthesis enzyme MoeA-like protein
LTSKSVVILCVSREILEGAVVDRNAAFIASRVDNLGYRVRAIQVVDRVESDMVTAITCALQQDPAFLLITGGMGHDWDDNSRACAAKAIGVPLVEDPRARECVANSYRRLFAKGLVSSPDLTPERARMAQVPQGATCHENSIGTSPALQLKSGQTTVFLLPGVPAEMQRLFQTFVAPAIVAASPRTVRSERHIDYFGTDMAAINRVLRETVSRHAAVDFRTRRLGAEEAGAVRITLVAEHESAAESEALLDRAETELRNRLGPDITAQPTDAGRILE